MPSGRPRTTLVYEEKDERFDVGVWKSRDHKYLFLDSQQPHDLRGALPARGHGRRRS